MDGPELKWTDEQIEAITVAIVSGSGPIDRDSLAELVEKYMDEIALARVTVILWQMVHKGQLKLKYEDGEFRYQKTGDPFK